MFLRMLFNQVVNLVLLNNSPNKWNKSENLVQFNSSSFNILSFCLVFCLGGIVVQLFPSSSTSVFLFIRF